MRFLRWFWPAFLGGQMIYNVMVVPDPDKHDRFVLEIKGHKTPNLTMDELLEFIRIDVEKMDAAWKELRG
jgi:hypothetical protein